MADVKVLSKMTLETVLPFLEGILAGRKEVCESALVFCGAGS